MGARPELQLGWQPQALVPSRRIIPGTVGSTSFLATTATTEARFSTGQ